MHTHLLCYLASTFSTRKVRSIYRAIKGLVKCPKFIPTNRTFVWATARGTRPATDPPGGSIRPCQLAWPLSAARCLTPGPAHEMQAGKTRMYGTHVITQCSAYSLPVGEMHAGGTCMVMHHWPYTWTLCNEMGMLHG